MIERYRGRMGRSVIRILAVVAALAWTVLFPFALYAVTFVQCFMNEHCRLPLAGYAAIAAIYAAGLAAGRFATRWALRLQDERAVRRRSGIM